MCCPYSTALYYRGNLFWEGTVDYKESVVSKLNVFNLLQQTIYFIETEEKGFKQEFSGHMVCSEYSYNNRRGTCLH